MILVQKVEKRDFGIFGLLSFRGKTVIFVGKTGSK